MKTLTCLTIDDERHAAELLNTYIQKTPGLAPAGIYTNPLKALEAINESTSGPDITFLDIDMPELSGIDLAGLISRKTSVVFTTSFPQYGPEAFEKNAADYLLKPISYERFLRCIQKIREQHAMPARVAADHFFIKTEIKGKMLRVCIPDIRYIQSNDNYVHIFLAKEKLTAYLTLSELLAHLPAGQFSRIQKSIVVAHAHIRSVEHFQVRLLDRPEPLPIGRAYSDSFLKEIEASLLISKRKI